MILATAIFSVVGALFALASAAWLLLGFNPLTEKYMTVEGGGFGGGPTQPVGLRRLIKDQSKAAGLALAGAALQLVGVVLGFLAAS